MKLRFRLLIICVFPLLLFAVCVLFEKYTKLYSQYYTYKDQHLTNSFNKINIGDSYFTALGHMSCQPGNYSGLGSHRSISTRAAGTVGRVESWITATKKLTIVLDSNNIITTKEVMAIDFD